MSVTYVGEQEFIAQSLPSYSKNEFGIDTMTIAYKGQAPELTSYLSGLEQGTQSTEDERFYLQTWSVDTNPIYPTVTLSFKGLIDGIPDELASDDSIMQSLTVTADSPQNASRDMQFWANKTTYRYIAEGRPTSPSHTSTSNSVAPSIFSSVYRIGGNVVYGSPSLAVVVSLTPSVVNLVTGFSVEPIYGTPYFECVDTVINTYEAQ